MGRPSRGRAAGRGLADADQAGIQGGRWGTGRGDVPGRPVRRRPARRRGSRRPWRGPTSSASGHGCGLAALGRAGEGETSIIRPADPLLGRSEGDLPGLRRPGPRSIPRTSEDDGRQIGSPVKPDQGVAQLVGQLGALDDGLGVDGGICPDANEPGPRPARVSSTGWSCRPRTMSTKWVVHEPAARWAREDSPREASPRSRARTTVSRTRSWASSALRVSALA